MNGTGKTTLFLVCLTLLLGVLFGGPGAQASPSAREVMAKVAMTRQLDASEAVVKMTLINDKGQKRERTLSMASKLFDQGKTEKRIYAFLAPADIKGTRLLVYDYETEVDDVWVYLPALRQTRRILAAQRSRSFMGSDFTYADLNVPPLDDFDYELVGQGSHAGQACYVIEARPKSELVAEREGYRRKSYWVSKDSLVVRKALYYDDAGKVFKELTTDQVKLVDAKRKRYRPMRLQMVNHQDGRRSVFHVEKFAVTANTKDEYFTTRYLERR